MATAEISSYRAVERWIAEHAGVVGCGAARHVLKGRLGQARRREIALTDYLPEIRALMAGAEKAAAQHAAGEGRRRETKWHVAPDGTPCCCTAEERRYGLGCH